MVLILPSAVEILQLGLENFGFSVQRKQRTRHVTNITRFRFLASHLHNRRYGSHNGEEISGAADGIPGWTVDRYGDWLFVNHDPKTLRGPLPSIHYGNTTGIYDL
jgi:hypothetical protein